MIPTTDKMAHLSAVEVLAAMSQNAIRRGDTGLGSTRLIECLTLLQSSSGESGVAALEAVADLAAAAGQAERAVEFYGACERVLEAARLPQEPGGSERRATALASLRAGLAPEKFDAAWTASRVAPHPLEFYVSAALRWLDGFELGTLPKASVDGKASDFNPLKAVNPGSTAVLIAQVRDGNTSARERLAGRFLEALRRFGHGRLPDSARDMIDTDDLVQITLLNALERVHSVDADKKGNFLAYMRKILVNKVRDEVRRSAKKPQITVLTDAIASDAPSPLEETLEKESLAAYYRALSRLSPRQRKALILRIEHGFSYQQVAGEIGSPSADAARMVIARGLVAVTKNLPKH